MTRLLSLLSLILLLAAGPALAAFTVNADGTVTDTVTGLNWDQCSYDQTGSGCTGTAGTYTWQQALQVAVTANAANYKGHNDWRLPNKNELESLVKIDTYNPSIDTTAFPNTPSEWYWSSTIYTPFPSFAWGVDFNVGNAYANIQTHPYHVRLVRSGQSFTSFDLLNPTAGATPATPVPTLGPWLLLTLSGVLGLAGVLARRKRG